MRADRLAAIQAALADEGLDAWLFCDFRGSDPIAARIKESGAEVVVHGSGVPDGIGLALPGP